MNRLFLLDAYALIYRAYYAFINNPRIDSKGRNMSAVFGFALTLFDIIEKEHPDAIAICFDPKEPTFRHLEYPSYKAQRDAAPEGIIEAIPLIAQLLEVLQIPMIEVAGYEADDAVGSLARLAEEAGDEVFMVTGDKDYGQLVTDRVKIYRPSHNGGYEVWGKEEVQNKFGVRFPKQMIDYLGLVGDSSDNIPGCRGIGPKTAVSLLEQYIDINEIYQNIDQIKPTIAKKLRENKEETLMSRDLVTIERFIPSLTLPEDRFKRKNPIIDQLDSLFTDWEFRTLKSRFPKISLDTPPSAPLAEAIVENREEPHVDTFDPSRHNYQMISTQAELEDWLKKSQPFDKISFDCETTSTDHLSAQLVGVSLSIREGEGIFIYLPEDATRTQKILSPLVPIFSSPKILKIAHNAKYDLGVLTRYGLPEARPLFDTMLAHYVCDADKPHNLSSIVLSKCQYRMIEYNELSTQKQFDIRKDVSPEQLTIYAVEDADYTLRIYEPLKAQLQEEKLEELFYKIEIPLMFILLKMEQTGVGLDLDRLSDSRKALNKKLSTLSSEIYELAGTAFNINSPRQVGGVLFDVLQISDKPQTTKTGTYSTNEEVLQKMKSKHPIVSKILDYRELKKLLNTYIDALPNMLYPDGKLHTSYNQAVTTTGRLSSSKPNLQNIPIRSELGKEIRAAFISTSRIVANQDLFSSTENSIEHKAVLVSADYSQVELRIIAHLSNDENLIDAFFSGEDIHTSTAAKIFGVPPLEVTSSMRSKAKTANFGINYGITPFGLSERLSIPMGEAKQLIEAYFAQFPKVKEYMEQAILTAREKGYTETAFGRRRYLPNISSRNGMQRSMDERNAINAPIQGTAADVIKKAMIDIDKQFTLEGLKSEMILQVHDELVFNVYENEKKRALSIIKEKMETAWKECRVPLLVEIGEGDNWLEAH